MVACASCGRENSPDARFCSACGAPLDVSRGARKTVTVLFSDIVGSTALGEQLDPEAMRLAVSRYFDAMRVVIERHGGTVEKFAGDAVMAVFGVPQLHEDDALRAVRAALAMADATRRVNDVLEEELGISIASRTGVNTGEVATGAGQTLATGSPVNLAARLEQAASPGEILIGAGTYAAVRHAVHAEVLGTLDLKGASAPVEAWRVVGAVAEDPGFTRRISAPFVGRREELERLRRALERSVSERRCELATIIGTAGIGKSRLARELVQTADGHRIVVGRCLPYGDGITFWPLAEIVRQLPPLQALLAGEDDGELIAQRVGAAIGTTATGGPADETTWAFRRLLETLARDRPLLVVVDDIHWAEPALLDLLEYVVSLTSDAPLFLLCLARPDLVEERPSWVAPRPNGTVLPLDALPEHESSALVDRLAGGLDDDERTRIVDAAEGNPLFVEQLAAYRAESGGGSLHVPPTIQALLAARIDRLPPDERAIVERASIEGRMFHRGAVTALLPDEQRTGIESHLIALLRKDLIRPDSPHFAPDDGFRFAHILIRDAAYDAVPKQLRAELHERYAGWLEAKAGDRVGEYEEILGYHLEQAYAYRAALGRVRPTDADLAARAAAFLAASGRRARLADVAAAAKLLSRAEALLPEDDPQMPSLLMDLGRALHQVGELERSQEVLAQAAELAGSRDDLGGEALARVLLASSRVSSVASRETIDELRVAAERAIPIFEATRNSLGLTAAWKNIGWVNHLQLRMRDAEKALTRAVAFAPSADDPTTARAARNALVQVLETGPTPASEAIRRSEELLASMPAGSPEAIRLQGYMAPLYAAQGRFDEARAFANADVTSLEQLGRRLELGAYDTKAAIEMWAGDLSVAEETLRTGLRIAEEIGSRYSGASLWATLSLVLYEQGRYDEALSATHASEELAAGRPGYSQLLRRAVRAMVLAHSEEHEAAEELAREAVAGVGAESLAAAGEMQMYLAEVLRLAGRHDEARTTLGQALRRFELKEHVVLAARARAALSGLDDELTSKPSASGSRRRRR